MRRFFRTLILILILALMAGAAIVVFGSRDSFYGLQEWASNARYHRYDEIITRTGAKYQIDPMLLKAVVWRESTFDPTMVGKDGERGLMQVTEAAARDWAKSQKNTTFVPNDLFDPQTNIEIGAWYLSQALHNYSGKDDAIPFALAEYNAGRQRVKRWIGENNLEPVTAKQFVENIDFSSTRKYVDTIIERYHYYKERGRF